MKDFLEEYGFAILAAIVIILLITMCTPVGNLIKTQITGIVDNFAAKTEAKFYTTNEVTNAADETIENFTDNSLPRLPDEYQEVEYIESTGAQYIDTGFIPNQDTKAEFKFQYTANNQGYRFFGTDSNNDTKAFRFGTTVGKAWLLRYGNKRNDVSILYTPLSVHTCVMDKNNYYLDGVLLSSFPYTNFTGYGNAYIFSINSPGMTDLAKAKLYYAKIYDNDNLIRDFVPCYRKLDNEIGLYDLCGSICPLTGTPFYINNEPFKKGSDVLYFE